MPDGHAEALLRTYAVLLRAKGCDVTESDVHDAWSAWMAERDHDHGSLVVYDELPGTVQDEDRIFVTAIRRAADELGIQMPSRPRFAEVLFPFGPPEGEAAIQQALDLYKIMVQSSESLVGRRQGVNTFFLTMNGALLTTAGLIVQHSAGKKTGALGIAVLAVAGVVLCGAWRSLILSFGQLNRGKFQVINYIERYLKASIYAAEWEALGKGQDPKIYRSFTSREIWVANTLLGLYIVAILAALAVADGVLNLT